MSTTNSNTKPPFELLDDRMLIVPMEEPDRSPGGILLPDVARQKSQRGKVIGVGPGKPSEWEDSLIPMRIKVGDEVLFPKYAGHEFFLDNVTYKVMHESEVLMRVVK